MNSSAVKSPDDAVFKYYLLLLASLLILVVGLIFSKIGSEDISIDDFSIMQFFNIFIFLGYICLILQGLAWIFVVRKLDLSFAYPFMSLSYVLILIIAYVMFDESITIWEIGGSFLIIFGITSISLGERRKRQLD